LSFIIGNTINLYEHQSTPSPNLPLRGLRYISLLYNNIAAKSGKSEYGTTLIRLPYPQCVVFYNGTDYQEERKILRLSDAYYKVPDFKREPCLEFTVTFININYGNNKELLNKCCELEGYSLFYHLLREYQSQGMESNDAIHATIDKCIKSNILKDILIKHKAEIMDIMLTEFDEEKYYRTIREEAAEKAAKEAKEAVEKAAKEAAEKKEAKIVLSMHKKGFTLSQIAEILEITSEKIEKIING
jgi:hypothetical protein